MKFKLYLRKILVAILAVLIVLFALSGVYATRNIDKLAYVIAIGLDTGESAPLKLSIQLSKTESSSGSSSSEGFENIINSVECSSISSGIALFNSYISRRINLSHCKVIVISEELAATGISEYIYTLANDIEMNHHANVIISKSKASEFLNFSEPELESLPSKYYETALNSNQYTGYTQNVTLIEFFSDYMDTFKNPVAILGSVNSGTTSTTNGNSNTSSDSVSVNSLSDSLSDNETYIAGQTPITSKINIENMGLAVFNSDKLVGELNGIETIYHLIVSNNLNSCSMSIPNPLGDSNSIDISLTGSSTNNVTFVNGTPFISVKINVDIQILSATEESTLDESSYYTSDNVKLIEETCSKYLEENILNYLYKTSKEYKSDIDGFGKYAVKYFTTIQDWEQYNWLDNFESSTFSVEVSSSLKSGHTFL